MVAAIIDDLGIRIGQFVAQSGNRPPFRGNLQRVVVALAYAADIAVLRLYIRIRRAQLRISGTRRERSVSCHLQLFTVVARAHIVDRHNRICPERALEAKIVLVGIWILQIRVKEAVTLAEWIW